MAAIHQFNIIAAHHKEISVVPTCSDMLQQHKHPLADEFMEMTLYVNQLSLLYVDERHAEQHI